MKTSRLLTVVLSVCMGVLLLTASIAAPILCRPFYYAHIDAMHLTEITPWSREEIQQAYDEMLDFCLGKGEFSTGVMAWTDWGKAHFEDVKVLFLLDLRVLGASLGLLAAVLLYARFTGRRPARPRGRGPGFWAGAGLGGAFLLVGALAALDFNRAFVVFHALFFPGKDNWLFDPATDPVINVLTEGFFASCFAVGGAIYELYLARFLLKK